MRAQLQANCLKVHILESRHQHKLFESQTKCSRPSISIFLYARYTRHSVACNHNEKLLFISQLYFSLYGPHGIEPCWVISIDASCSLEDLPCWKLIQSVTIVGWLFYVCGSFTWMYISIWPFNHDLFELVQTCICSLSNFWPSRFMSHSGDKKKRRKLKLARCLAKCKQQTYSWQAFVGPNQHWMTGPLACSLENLVMLPRPGLLHDLQNS